MFFVYHGALMRFATRRLGNPEDAADLVQDIYFRLARKNDIAGLEHPRAFLFQTAVNLLRDRARRDRVRQRSHHVPYHDLVLVEDAPNPERVLVGKQALNRFERALDGLSAKCRRVFTLHRFECMTYSQIATHCGCSVSAVEKHMMKAIAHLDRAMGDR
jgi:RNA polymerase sigma factor (sigma-70 family)